MVEAGGVADSGVRAGRDRAVRRVSAPGRTGDGAGAVGSAGEGFAVLMGRIGLMGLMRGKRET